MRRTLTPCLLWLIAAIAPSKSTQAQRTPDDHVSAIKARSELWNTAYNGRDSLAFYTLFDSLTVMSSAGGRWIGAEQCKLLCRSLYAKRPDISWTNTPDSIAVNEQWQVAYETGDWDENWTEAGDTDRSRILGKYWIMWKYKSERWVIISAIFTPMSCTGSYCTKKK